MLMSKSRLEKFLYALYSLDSSYLPTPLSRIEELYKCLVTGEEAPTFKPLSRVEKYLMAILGVHDVDSLPNPLSRVEVLLYKLATGDDNLDDVKSFLSEHEELLAEIIRNGGAGGNINIEYVLYTLSTEHNTLYNTAEKPVKSAILKGNTLVNLAPNDTFKGSAANRGQEFTLTQPIQPNKQYILLVNITKDDTVGGWHCRFTDGVNYPVFQARIKGVGLKKVVFTTSIALSKFFPYFELEDCEQGRYITMENVMLLEYQQGMENWDIPYFEGMQSVKMPVLTTVGKNLFNGELENGAIVSSTGANTPSIDNVRSVGYIKVNPNASIVLSNDLNYSNNIIYEYDINKNYIGRKETNPFTTSTNCHYIRFRTDANQPNLDVKYQIEYGTIATPYEPFKSNILTVNEDVHLRKVNDIYDELDLLTGELTTNIREYVYIGSPNEQWRKVDNVFEIPTDGLHETTFGSYKLAISNKFKVVNYGTWVSDGGSQSNVMLVEADKIKIKTNYSTIDEFRNQLLDNPLIVQVKSKEKSIKTVDLSTVNQDGNNTELYTFNDITHVRLSSEGLIPEAELEVATKNEEVLNTMSLEMDDISATQTTLKETSDTQSENVDATMIATTEIYEQLL